MDLNKLRQKLDEVNKKTTTATSNNSLSKNLKKKVEVKRAASSQEVSRSLNSLGDRLRQQAASTMPVVHDVPRPRTNTRATERLDALRRDSNLSDLPGRLRYAVDPLGDYDYDGIRRGLQNAREALSFEPKDNGRYDDPNYAGSVQEAKDTRDALMAMQRLYDSVSKLPHRTYEDIPVFGEEMTPDEVDATLARFDADIAAAEKEFGADHAYTKALRNARDDYAANPSQYRDLNLEQSWEVAENATPDGKRDTLVQGIRNAEEDLWMRQQANRWSLAAQRAARDGWQFDDADYEQWRERMKGELAKNSTVNPHSVSSDMRLYYTKDEAAVYAYLEEQGRSDDVAAYYSYMQPIAAERRNAEIAEDVLELGTVGRTAVAIAANPLKVFNGLSIMLQEIDRGISGSARPVDYHTYGHYGVAGNLARESVTQQLAAYGSLNDLISRATGSETHIPLIGDLTWGDIYGLGLDQINSLTNTLLFGKGLAGTAMYAQAGTDAYVNAQERGLNDSQALLNAVFSGTAEGIGEQIGLNALWRGWEKTAGKGLKGILAFGLLQGLEGGLQETATTAMEQAADRFFLGDYSEYSMRVAELVAEGYDQYTAETIASDEAWDEILKSGLMGALGQGGTYIAGAPIAAYRNNYAVGADIKAQGNADVLTEWYNEISNKDKATPKTTAGIGRMYNDLVKNTGKHIRNIERSEMDAAVAERYQQEIGSDVQMTKQQQAIRDALIRKARGKTVSRATGRKMAANAPETLADIKAKRIEPNRSKSTGASFKAAMAPALRHVPLAEAKSETSTEREPFATTDETRAKAEQRQQDITVDAAAASAAVNGEAVTVQEVVATAQGDTPAKVRVTDSDGQTREVNINDVVYNDVRMAELHSYAEDMASPELANQFIAAAGNNQDLDQLANAINNAWDMGNAGYRIDSARKSILTKGLTEQQLTDAFNLGASARAAEIQRKADIAAKRQQANANKRWTSGRINMGDVVYETLSNEQKRNLDLVDVIAGLFGMNVEIFESKADSEGKYTAENGSYNKGTNTIRLDVNAGRNYKGDSMAQTAMLRTMSHELTHAMQRNQPAQYEAYRNAVLDVLKRQGADIDQLVNRKLATDSSLKTRDAAIDEIVADASETMLRDSDAVERLRELHPEQAKTFAQKVLELIKRIKDAIREAFGSGELTREAQYAIKELDKLAEMWSDMAVATAEVSGRETFEVTSQGAVVSPAVAEVMESSDYAAPSNEWYSVRETNAWAEAHRKEYPNDAEFEYNLALIQAFDRNVAADSVTRYLVPHGRIPKTAKGPLRNNVEYVYTFDMDTKCERTYQFLAYRDAIQKKIGRQLYEDEARCLIELMRAYGQMIPCTYCYVEGKRMKLAELYMKYLAKNGENVMGSKYTAEQVFDIVEGARTIVSGYLDDKYNIPENYTIDRTLANDTFEGYRDFKMPVSMEEAAQDIYENYNITDKAAKRVIAGYVAEWIYSRSMDVPMNLVNTEADFRTDSIDEKVLSFHDLAGKAAQGGAKAKGIENYEPYVDQLKNISVEDKRYMVGMGGIRKHSSNDFQIQNMQDYMLFFMDLAADKRGGVDWTGHTYTKNLDYARIFAPTNDRINVSIAMYGDNKSGIRANTQEGVVWEELQEVRKKYSNVGAMAMVTNNDQLSFALNSDWIDMIVPFHASGMKRSLYYDVLAWTDYTSKQSERLYTKGQMIERLRQKGIKVNSSAKAGDVQRLFMENFDVKTVYNEKTGKRVAPHFFPGETVQHGVTIPGHNNDAQRYLELCEQYGTNPRFFGVKVQDANGNTIDVTEHPAYLKLIKETARTDTPQQPIVAKFDMDYVNKAMSGFRGYANLSEDSYGIVDEFVNEYVGKKRKVGYLTERAQQYQKIRAQMAAEEAAKLAARREEMLENINAADSDVQYQARSYGTERMNWAVEEGLLTKADQKVIHRTLANKDYLKYNVAKTKDGKYVIPCDTVIIFASGTYNRPVIEDVVIFNVDPTEYERAIEDAMEVLYGDERSYLGRISKYEAHEALAALLQDGLATVFSEPLRTPGTAARAEGFREGNSGSRASGGNRERRGSESVNEIQKQARPMDALSDREILANALEDVATTPEEKLRLAAYKEGLAALNEKQAELDKNKAIIRELMFKKGRTSEDSERLLKARNRAEMLAKEVDRKDKALLNLERMEPIKAIVKREGDKVRKERNAVMKERLADVRQGHENAALRKSITRRAKRLDELVRVGDKSKFVPDNLRDAVADVVSIFAQDDSVFGKKENAQGIPRWQRLQNAYEAIRQTSGDIARQYDEAIAEKLKYLHDTLDGKNIKALNGVQLKAVRDVLMSFQKLISDGNKIFRAGRAELIEDMSNEFIEDASRAKGFYAWSGNSVVKWVRDEMAIPPYFFKRLGGVFEKLGNDILRAESDWGLLVGEYNEKVHEIYKKYHHKDWANKKGDTLQFTTDSGTAIELTREQALSIYAISERQRRDTTMNSHHLDVGGIKLPIDKDGLSVFKAKKLDNAPVPISAKDVTKITAWLTEEQIGYANAMVELMSNDLAKLGNVASRQLHGWEKFQEEFYFPYVTDKSFFNTQLGKTEQLLIKDLSHAKGLAENATSPLELTDFTQTANRHIANMILYSTFAVPQDNFMRLYDHHLSDGNTIKDRMRATYGEWTNKYIEQLMKDMYGSSPKTTSENVVDEMLGKIRNNTIKNRVLFSRTVTVQQFSSVFRAMYLINPKYFVHSPNLGGWKEAQKYAGTAVIKKMGGFDIKNSGNVVDMLMNENWRGIEGDNVLGKIVDAVDKGAGIAPATADAMTWGAIWQAVKREQAAKTGLSIHSEELKQLAGKRFDEVMRFTQVYGSTLTKSPMMRSSSATVRALATYQGETTLSFNMAYDAIWNKKNTVGQKARAFAFLLITLTTGAISKSLVTAIGDDDDEESVYVERVLRDFTGEMVGNFIPFNYIPIASQIWSELQGFTTTRDEFAFVSNFVKVVEVIGDEDATLDKKLRSIASFGSSMTRVPFYNIYRELKRSGDLINDIQNNGDKEKREGWATNAALSGALDQIPFYSEFAPTPVERIYNAALDGNDEDVARYREYMILYKGKDDKQINSSLRSEIKKGYLKGDMNDAQAIEMLTEYAGLNISDAEDRVLEWSYEREVGSDIGDEGSTYDAMKEDYLNGDISRDEAIDSRMKYGGASESDAEALVLKWDYEKETGIAYDDMKDEYIAGNISRREAESARVKYGGKKREDAEADVKKWDYEKKYGHPYTDMKDEYLAGRITKQQAIDARVKYGGVSEKTARRTVEGWDDEK